jgi:hypothetical protein
LLLAALGWLSALTLAGIALLAGFGLWQGSSHFEPGLARFNTSPAWSQSIADASGPPALRSLTMRSLASGTCTAGSRNAFGESVTIAAGEHICGDASVYGGRMTVFGEVDGSVTAVGGDVTIYGDVHGDVRAIGGSVYLHDGAHVMGDVHAVGGNVVRTGTPVVGGNIQRDVVRHDMTPLQWFGLTDSYAFPWLSMLFWVLAAACIAHFLPEPLGRVRAIARSDFSRSLLTGVVTLVAGAIVSLVLIATCLGIPVALAVLGAMWLAWVVGTVALGLWLGDRLLHRVAAGGHTPVSSAVLGVAIIALAESIPCVGGVLSVVLGCASLGAVTLAVLHARRTPYRGPRMAWPA